MFKKILTASGLSAALIASALVSAPTASAAEVPGVPINPAAHISVKVSAKEAIAGTNINRPLTINIQVPDPFLRYGNLNEHRYSATTKFSGKNCHLNSKERHNYGFGDANLTVGYTNFDGETNRVWGKPGKCDVTTTVVVTSTNAYGNQYPAWSHVVTSKTSFNVRAKNSVTKPKASISKVKKGKKVTLSGKATYAYLDNRYTSNLTKANVAKKTPLILQQKVAGSKKWKNVKTVKVGAKGKWATKVKVKKTTQYRVVLKKSAKYVGKTSSATKVTVKKATQK